MTASNKHTVKINGHITSVFLESEFWEELQRISKDIGVSSDRLISEIDQKKSVSNLSSAIRLYILNHIRTPK
jgi:predicted DNA-binding ribbon-helix-helix protein